MVAICFRNLTEFSRISVSRRMRCLISMISGQLIDREIVGRHSWIGPDLRCSFNLLSRGRPVNGSRKKIVDAVA